MIWQKDKEPVGRRMTGKRMGTWSGKMTKSWGTKS